MFCLDAAALACLGAAKACCLKLPSLRHIGQIKGKTLVFERKNIIKNEKTQKTLAHIVCMPHNSFIGAELEALHARPGEIK